MSNLAKPTTQQVIPPEAVDPNSTLREPHRHGTSAREFWVETVWDVEALMAHQLAWDDLAAHAIERNPFYESWMLIDGVKHFGSNVDLQFNVVW